MIIPAQFRAARGLLGWSQTKLAEASGLAISTIKRMEGSEGVVRGHAENVWRVQAALEEAGIIFIDEFCGGAGVRLKARSGR